MDGGQTSSFVTVQTMLLLDVCVQHQGIERTLCFILMYSKRGINRIERKRESEGEMEQKHCCNIISLYSSQKERTICHPCSGDVYRDLVTFFSTFASLVSLQPPLDTSVSAVAPESPLSPFFIQPFPTIVFLFWSPFFLSKCGGA